VTLARGADFSSAQTGGEVSRDHPARHPLRDGQEATEGVHYTSPAMRWQIGLLESNGVAAGPLPTSSHPDVDGADQWDYFEQLARLVAPRRLRRGRPRTRRARCPAERREIARAFIRRGHQRGYKIGRYGDNDVIRRQPRRGLDLGRLVEPDTATSFKWKLWQFSDGGGKQDWNVFNGGRRRARPVAHHVASPTSRRANRSRGETMVAPRRLHQSGARAVSPPRLAAAVVVYATRHPRTAKLRLERK